MLCTLPRCLLAIAVFRRADAYVQLSCECVQPNQVLCDRTGDSVPSAFNRIKSYVIALAIVFDMDCSRLRRVNRQFWPPALTVLMRSEYFDSFRNIGSVSNVSSGVLNHDETQPFSAGFPLSRPPELLHSVCLIELRVHLFGRVSFGPKTDQFGTRWTDGSISTSRQWSIVQPVDWFSLDVVVGSVALYRSDGSDKLN